MTAKVFVKALKEEVLAHPVYDHPLMTQISQGTFSLDQVRQFAIQYYHCYGDFNRYIGLLVPLIPDEEIRILMARNLMDELGGLNPGKTHPALFRRFLRGIGLTQQDWEQVRPLPAVSLHVDRHAHLCGTDFLRGLATIGPGTEWSVPNWFTKIVQGLRQGLTLPEGDLEYWTVHITLDIEHSCDAEVMLEYYAKSEEAQRKLREGALFSLEATQLMLDELLAHVFGA